MDTPERDAAAGDSSVGLHAGLPSWPVFDDEMILAAERVLRSGKVNYWTGGEVRAFEQEFSREAGCSHAVATSSGTAALELVFRALGIGPGDEVVIPCRTFFASASSVVACGATPVVADVDINSQNITADTMRPHFSPRTKAVVAVHLAGRPCEMEPILNLAGERGIAVIEDCAQAHGASYRGAPVGSMGVAGVFSFCQDKIMTTAGEGGMVVTSDRAIFESVWSLKDHGKDYQKAHSQPGPPGFRWLHDRFGSNLRMTEIQAAVGRVALRRLKGWVATRKRNALVLDNHLSGLAAVRVPGGPSHISNSYYKYYAFVRPERLRGGWDRDRIMREINARGVPCFSGSCSEIYREKAFDGFLHSSERMRAGRELGETSLMFQVHPTLSAEDMKAIGECVAEVFRVADGKRAAA